jgi:dipeptidyl aminopeptidase/acylaminoacyl peptidase
MRLYCFASLGLLALASPAQSQTEPRAITYYNPTWSPDSRAIAFESNRDGTSAVYTVVVDGGALHKLTPDGVEAYQPSWSPDGRRIVFAMKREAESDLYLVNADGSGQLQLTSVPGGEFYASFSPDGRSIVFGMQHRARREVYYVGVVGADGSGYRLLTDSTSASSGPRWSADGRRIEFTRTPLFSPNPGEAMRDLARRREQASRLVSVRPDGSDVRELGPAPGEGEPGPVDSPDRRYAVEARDGAGSSGLYLTEKATGRERVLVGPGGRSE